MIQGEGTLNEVFKVEGRPHIIFVGGPGQTKCCLTAREYSYIQYFNKIVKCAKKFSSPYRPVAELIYFLKQASFFLLIFKIKIKANVC